MMDAPNNPKGFEQPLIMDSELRALPARSSVAIVTMLGSLCPVTRAHVEMFTEARKLLLEVERRRPELGIGPYAACVCFVSLNGDGYVMSKLKPLGDTALSMQQRLALVDMATADIPWLQSCKGSHHSKIDELHQQWPHLIFDHFEMNGADDVVKYQKWKYIRHFPHQRYITMGRPGSMEQLREGMQRSAVSESANFLLGPELPDLSSTRAREASKRGDRETLLNILHPAVADWLLKFTPKSECKDKGPTP